MHPPDPLTDLNTVFGTPVSVVCPRCHQRLSVQGESIECCACGSRFGFSNGFPDLVLGERYDDPTSDNAILDEEESNRDTTRRYWIPLFRKFWPNPSSPTTILSLGTGVGTEVDLLCDAGFNSMGVDCGKRTAVWWRRCHRNRLLMANGKYLPFPDQTFDGIFCGCVFPHVGVVGATYKVTKDYYAQRLALAREMTRVLKPCGKIVVCNPNRLFPFDIFHEHTSKRFRMRLTLPWERLLLSRGDYEKMFREAGCTRATGLQVHDYWGFTSSKKTLKGRLASLPIRFLFWLVSLNSLTAFRTSFLNPWIIVLIEKAPHGNKH